MTNSALQLIKSKLAPPSWIGGQVVREKLIKQLDAVFTHRLSLIVAPAGYGKTSLLSQWWNVERNRKSCFIAWVTLEAEDADVAMLARYIQSALQIALLDDAGDAAHKSGYNNIPPSSSLSAALNLLDRFDRPVVIVFDDLHSAGVPEVELFLRKFIKLAPSHCHFVFASRDQPRLDQATLAAENQFFELGMGELKFSEDEAEKLLIQNTVQGIGDTDFQKIYNRTEGWPIALQLTFLSLKQGVDLSQLVDRFSQPTGNLAEYLSEQVLLSLSPEDEEIVSHTVLLDHLTGEAVNFLCDRQDGWDVLVRLEGKGVFLMPDSPNRNSYRYHQVFRDYLRSRLERNQSELYTKLHKKAARWYGDQGRIGRAVSHAINANDEKLIAALVDEAGGWRLIPIGRIDVLSQAIDHISDEILEENPGLKLGQIYLMIKGGDLTGARECYQEYTTRIEAEILPTGKWNEVKLVGDIISEYENRPVTLDDLIAREALIPSVNSDDHIMLGHLNEALGAQYLDGGWLERALGPILEARRHHQALGSLYSDLFTQFLEARVRRGQGRLNEALQILNEAKLKIENSFGARSDLAANCASYLGELAYDQDRLDDVDELLEWALPHMEESDGWFEVYTAAYFTSARRFAAKGSLRDSKIILDEAKSLARRRGLLQLEITSELCWFDIELNYDTSTTDFTEKANALKVITYAAEMKERSPHYRQVAIIASMCLVKMQLLSGDAKGALETLEPLRTFAREHGVGRLLIEVDILTSAALEKMDDSMAALKCLDEAVNMSIFQNIIRPFVDLSRFYDLSAEHRFEIGEQSDRFKKQFLQTVSKALSQRRRRDDAEGALTSGELEILNYLNNGLSNKEIARLTSISPNTVKFRLKSVFKKLDVSKRRDAVMIAREKGLVEVQESS